LGGYFGPLAVGTLKKLTGNFQYGFVMLSVGLLAAAGLALLLSPVRTDAQVAPGGKVAAGLKTAGFRVL
jgi:MFS-type transporter involved in bile tolerance (Atg22 family)